MFKLGYMQTSIHKNELEMLSNLREACHQVPAWCL